MAVADGIMGQHGVQEAMHYCDDFLVFGPTDSDECRKVFGMSMQPFQSLDVVIALRKTDRPSAAISFLLIQR